MENLIGKLNDLIAIDLDAINAYAAAIKRMTAVSLRDRLTEFKRDHQKHVEDLSAHVKKMGGTPRSTPDLKGFVLRGFTAFTSMAGNRGALMAMRGNEVLTNRIYHQALNENWRPDILTTIEKNYADEQRHLAFIRKALKDHAWEQQRGVEARP